MVAFPVPSSVPAATGTPVVDPDAKRRISTSALGSPVTVRSAEPVLTQPVGAARVIGPVGAGVPLGQAARRRLDAGMMSSSPVLIGVEVRVVSRLLLKNVHAL